MRVISEAEIAGIIDEALAYEAVAQAFRAAAKGEVQPCPVVHGVGGSGGETFSVKAAGAPGRGLAGLKVGTYWPGNAARGLSNHGATTLLLDAETGRPAAILDATLLNRYRTAAANAVATDVLAKAKVQTYTLLGAGQQAAYEARAVMRVRDVESVLIWSRTREAAEHLAGALKGAAPSVEVCDVEAAVRAADIITTVTKAHTALFEAGWVKPGCHIAAMGADRPGKQELPAELYAKARLFADSPEQSRQTGEFQHAGEGLSITAIGAVLDDPGSGRASAEDITVFDSSGLAIQDLMAAQAVLDALENHGR